MISKILGYAHIPQQFAVQVNPFDREYLNLYLNYHRPCFFPVVYVDKKGKERKRFRYEDMMTPYVVSLQDAQQYLKSGVTLKSLEAKAHGMTDNEAAQRLQNARENLLTVIYERPA
ncbi:hypothetical protein [Endozoicomonas arenosclerae]|uniref:hypothetical protein n=1 Tax=Endozoicomonas arenosclerae TaxID=1633495 RepID=UPI001C12A11F|nr:hypothetical protein [Endozoicomonas arenosclerae]